MTKRSTPKTLGASILLGIAAGSIPLAGCTIVGEPGPAVEVSAEEQRLYEAAIAAIDPVVVERYLRRYPKGRVRSVLAAQSPETLSRLANDAFAEIPPETLEALPASIRQNLPPSVLNSLELRARAGARAPRSEDRSDRSEDTYSG